MTSEIQTLQNDIADWADNTFGYNRHPIGALKHLSREVNELIDSPFDRFEYADCFILLIDSYRMAGGSADDLIIACKEKLEINKGRKWGKPDSEGIVEHIRE